MKRKFWKIRAFDYNQQTILIIYTNARFQSVGAASDFGTKFAPKNINETFLKK